MHDESSHAMVLLYWVCSLSFVEAKILGRCYMCLLTYVSKAVFDLWRRVSKAPRRHRKSQELDS